MTTTDQRALIAYDHNQLAELVDQSLQRAHKLAGHLPDEQRDELRSNIEAAYDGAANLSTLLKQSEAVLRDAERYVESATQTATEMKGQRDEAMDELHQIIRDVQNMNLKNEDVNALYRRVERSHEHSFWMALPYTLRRICGNGWQHDDGLVLRQVLTIDLDEFDYDDPDTDWVEEEFGFTQTALESCRHEILQAVRKLQGKSA